MIEAILVMPALLVLLFLFIREYFVTKREKDQLYKIDFEVGCGDEGYCFCPNEKSLLQFCLDDGWENIQDLLDETGLTMEEFLNRWFLIIDRRVFTK